MDFREVDRRYDELKRKYDAGTLSADAFDAQLRELMIQDDQGRWWAKSRDGGQWNYHDGSNWVRGTPPYPPEAPAAARTVITSPDPIPGYQPSQPAAQSYQPPQGGAAAYSAPAASAAAVPGEGEVSSGMAILFYLISFFIPIVGFVLFFLYRSKPSESDRKAATYSLYIALASMLLGATCCGCSFFLSLASSGG